LYALSSAGVLPPAHGDKYTGVRSARPERNAVSSAAGQTDRGQEFFAVSVQQWLIDHGIKFRPIKPASPHLNGKVARSQKTDRQEFWADANPNSPELEWWLPEWQHDDNWDRPHGSLNGQTSIAM